MLAFVGKYGYYDMAFPERFGDAERRTTGGSRRNADEKAFFRGEPATVVGCFLVPDGYDLVEDLPVEHSRNKSGANPLNLMIAWLAS